MNDLTRFIDQARLFAEQHVPQEVVSQALLIGMGVMFAGVLISVLGARLVRAGLAVAFGVAGAFAAVRVGHVLDVPLPMMVLLGGLLLGGIGYALHRLWVGLVVAAAASGLALSVFGYYRVLPEVYTYQELSAASSSAEGSAVDFALLDPSEQLEYACQSPRTWARDFWAHLTAQQADVSGKLAVIGVGAALVGLLLGLVVTRAALIVCTALLGTTLVMSGLSLVISTISPEVHAAALQQPRLLGGAWVGLLLASLVLQALLNRRPPARPVLEPAA